MGEKEQVVSEINKKVKELNDLFEKATSHHLKFDCFFNQHQNLGKRVAHLDISAYWEISPSAYYRLT